MAESRNDQQIELNVQGMTWVGWEPKVVRALGELPGVKEAYAHFPERRAVVVYDRALVSTEQMCQALLKAGYVANPRGEESATRSMSPKGPGHTKPHQVEELLCYCFGFTKQDIERDLLENGRSLIMEKIMTEKKTGGCDCKNLNPKGRWCLPDVRRVVEGASPRWISDDWIWMHQWRETWADNEHFHSGDELGKALFEAVRSLINHK